MPLIIVADTVFLLSSLILFSLLSSDILQSLGRLGKVTIAEGLAPSSRKNLSQLWNLTKISDSTSIELYREVETDTELSS